MPCWKNKEIILFWLNEVSELANSPLTSARVMAPWKHEKNDDILLQKRIR